MYVPEEYRGGKTADINQTRKRFSSSQQKPFTSKQDSTRKQLNKEVNQRKIQTVKLPSYGYAPAWKRQSLLEQLNRSLSVKQPQKQQEMPKHLLVMEENEDYELEKNFFFALIRKLPTERLQRNQENMAEFARQLPKLNSLFKGHSFLYICSLLKVGKIRFFEPNDIIYEKKVESSEFSIILWGKVKLLDKKDVFRKVSRRGQTLGEEVMFTNIRTRQEKATAIQQCYLLDLDLKTYQIFYQAMISNKLKSQVLMMEKNIKRNFISKNSLRSAKLQ